MCPTIQIFNIQENSEIKTINIDSVDDEIECLINSHLPEIIHTMILKDFPNDKVFFTNKLNTSDKMFIISKGPCQPDGPFPKNKSYAIKIVRFLLKT